MKRKIVMVNSIEFDQIKERRHDVAFLEGVMKELAIDSHVINRGLQEENLNFLGVALDDELAQKIADGEIDPVTYESFNEMELKGKQKV